MRLRSTCNRQRSLPLIPQVVQTLKSLSSLALLAVSQLCTTRSKLVRPLVRGVIPEPRRLDHAAALRCRGLLVLAGEIVFADRAADLLEHLGWLALGMQCLAAPSGKIPRPPQRLDLPGLVFLGDR